MFTLMNLTGGQASLPAKSYSATTAKKVCKNWYSARAGTDSVEPRPPIRGNSSSLELGARAAGDDDTGVSPHIRGADLSVSKDEGERSGKRPPHDPALQPLVRLFHGPLLGKMPPDERAQAVRCER